ncbi:MAG: hypoxanthine phosphoribosyltransferase [Malacoplasma sp.]
MNLQKKNILISNYKINKAIKKAAKWINENYKGKTLVLIGLLKGCIPFFGQLITRIKVDLIIDFLVVSSFKGENKAQGKPKIITNILTDLKGKDVLLLEDIIDSGYTIKYVLEEFQKQNPNSIKVMSLLNKKEGRKIDFDPDYYCFDIPNKFIVGFGLDYKEKERNLPHIMVFDRN